MSHEHRGDQASDDISVHSLFSRLAEIPRWRIPNGKTDTSQVAFPH